MMSYDCRQALTVDRRFTQNPLFRATQIPSIPIEQTTIIDATGGLGRDAFSLALFGFGSVRVIERNFVLFALLRDAIQRASKDAVVAEILHRSNFGVTYGDSLLHLTKFTRPHVVYLDPMYPAMKKRKALPKKEMFLARTLVGSDEDWESLLAVAKETAERRVVLKRPHHFKSLESTISYSIPGKQVHFDVYLCHSPQTSST